MGPCSAWPISRNRPGPGIMGKKVQYQATEVKATVGEMAHNLFKTGISAIKDGKLNHEQRNDRYAKCLECPLFIADSKRCSECGCFMEAKTWIKGASCPVGKW